MTENDNTDELTLVASGRIKTTETETVDAMEIERTRTETVTARLPLDGSRLYDSDIAATDREGPYIHTGPTAVYIAEQMDATAVDAQKWDLTVEGEPSTFETVATDAATELLLRPAEAQQLAFDILLALQETYSAGDQPAYAALNLDEQANLGRRQEALATLDESGEQTDGAAGEGVAADD